MTDIDTLLEQAATNNTAASPRELSTLALEGMNPEDYYATLDKVLPVYVRQWLAGRRVWRENTPTPPVPEVYTGAPDDLLSEPAQQIVQTHKTKMLKARGSARVTAIRTEWQRHFADSLWNGERYIKFGDATAVDLKGAADSLRNTAKAEYEGKISKATYYERIAEHLGDAKRVRDLTQDPTRV